MGVEVQLRSRASLLLGIMVSLGVFSKLVNTTDGSQSSNNVNLVLDWDTLVIEPFTFGDYKSKPVSYSRGSYSSPVNPRFAYIGTTPVYLYPSSFTASTADPSVVILDAFSNLVSGSVTSTRFPLETVSVGVSQTSGGLFMLQSFTTNIPIRYDLQVLGTVFSSSSQTDLTWNTFGPFFIETNTVYVFITHSGTNKLRKHDITEQTPTMEAGSQHSGTSTKLIQDRNGWILFWGRTSSALEFHQMINLQQTVCSVAGSAIEYYLLDNDPTTTDIAYASSYNTPTLNKYNKVFHLGQPALLATRTLISVGVSQLMNLGNFAMIALMDRLANTNGQLRIFYKANLVEVEPTTRQYPYVIDHTFCAGHYDPVTLRFNFAVANSTNPMISRGFITVNPTSTPTDSCIGRDPVSRICTNCPVGAYLDRPNMADNRCFQLSTGLASDLSVIRCFDLNCDECRIAQTCTRCTLNTSSENNYLIGTECKPETFIPLGYGRVVLTPGTYQTCQVAGCSVCQSDHLKCEVCNSVNQLVSYNRTACILREEIPPGYGPDNPPLKVCACDPAHCIECFQNYLSCDKCEAEFYKHIVGGEITNMMCSSVTNLPSGSGRNEQDSSEIQCSDNSCEECQSNAAVCTKCLDDYFLINHTCLDGGIFDDGQGYDAANRGVRSCSDTNCKDCKSDYSTCIACKPDFTFENRGPCTRVDQGPLFPNEPGAGGSGAQNNAPTNPDPIPDTGLGQNSNATQNTSQPNPTETKVPENANTAGQKQKLYPPKIINSRFSQLEQTVTITFDRPFQIQGLSALLSSSYLLDHVSGNKIPCSVPSQPPRCAIAFSDKSLTVTFHSDVAVTKATLRLNAQTDSTQTQSSAVTLSNKDDASAVFTEFPIETHDVFVGRSSTVQTAGGLMSFVSNTRSTMNLAMAATNPALAGPLNRFIATMLYPSYLEGPILVYPQYILANLQSFSIIPWSLFKVPNVLETETECIPSEGFEAQEVFCAVGANMGWDLITLLVLCVASVIGWTVWYRRYLARVRSKWSQRVGEHTANKLMCGEKTNKEEGLDLSQAPLGGEQKKAELRKEGEVEMDTESAKDWQVKEYARSSCSEKVLLWLKDSFGVSYLLVQLDSSQIDILTYCLLNIVNMANDSSAYHYFGVVVSLLSVTFYLWYAYWTLSYARAVWRQVQSYKKTHPEKEQVMMEDVILMEGPLKDLRYFLYEDMKGPKVLYQLILPSVTLVRSFMVVCSLVVITGNPAAQGLVVIFTEVCYLLFMVLANLKVKRVHFLMDLVVECLLLAYLVLKQFTLDESMDEGVRQDRYGHVMGIILIIFASLGILFSFYIIVTEMLLPLFQKLRELISKKSKVGSITISTESAKKPHLPEIQILKNSTFTPKSDTAPVEEKASSLSEQHTEPKKIRATSLDAVGLVETPVPQQSTESVAKSSKTDKISSGVSKRSVRAQNYLKLIKSAQEASLMSAQRANN